MNGVVLGINRWTRECGGGASFARNKHVDDGCEGANLTPLGRGKQISADGDIAFRQRSGRVCVGSPREDRIVSGGRTRRPDDDEMID